MCFKGVGGVFLREQIETGREQIEYVLKGADSVSF